ncbi:MAG: hypothetical protein HY784_16340 [Chloroflexi bacterium]|nr:hypothetical protein [Chloroflexota bacterium]
MRRGARSESQGVSGNGQGLEKRLAIELELDRQIGQYIGKWVAVVEDKIVAVGDNVGEVMEAARGQGYELPLVVRGPLAAEETFYIL